MTPPSQAKSSVGKGSWHLRSGICLMSLWFPLWFSEFLMCVISRYFKNLRIAPHSKLLSIQREILNGQGPLIGFFMTNLSIARILSLFFLLFQNPIVLSPSCCWSTAVNRAFGRPTMISGRTSNGHSRFRPQTFLPPDSFSDICFRWKDFVRLRELPDVQFCWEHRMPTWWNRR
jgi:hypothetical protein